MSGLEETPKRLIRAAAARFAKAAATCQGIDADVVGARGTVQYIVALAEAARADLLRALGSPPAESFEGRVYRTRAELARDIERVDTTAKLDTVFGNAVLSGEHLAAELATLYPVKANGEGA